MNDLHATVSARIVAELERGAAPWIKPCDRDLKNRFGSLSYAAEELVAELGAAFLCAEFGFDGDVRNAGYIASWIELLKADKRAFFTACSQASKAAEYLRGLALAERAERAA
jgi:antirestriction protein ArdC